MNNCLYLHIGIHKTGTTAVQEFFWLNKRKLELIDWSYPQVGLSGITHAGIVNSVDFPEREKSIIKMKSDFISENSPYARNQGESASQVLNELHAYVLNNATSKYFMSSECFFEWTDPQYFANVFKRIFDRIQVVIYLREQVSWINSVYNQLIKDPYFKYSGKIMELPQLSLLDYYEIIQQWEKAFGENSIIVKPYDASARENIVMDILETVGIDVNRNWDWPQSKRQNVSLHHKLAHIISELNTQQIEPGVRGKILSLFADLSSEISGFDKNSLLTVEEIQHIRLISTSCNEKLYQKYGILFEDEMEYPG